MRFRRAAQCNTAQNELFYFMFEIADAFGANLETAGELAGFFKLENSRATQRHAPAGFFYVDYAKGPIIHCRTLKLSIEKGRLL